jgi:hypothetical protein
MPALPIRHARHSRLLDANARGAVAVETSEWRARLPFLEAVWARPARVTVTEGDYRRSVAIHDITRWAQVAIAAAAVLVIVVLRRAASR